MPALRGASRLFYTPLRPLTLSVGFSMILPIRNIGFTSTPKPTEARCTRALFRHPSPAAARESPYPVVFLRTQGLGEGWVDWASMFAEKGYTAIEIDIAVPESSLAATPTPTKSEATSTTDVSASPIKAMTSSLASQIRLLAIPFPPLLVASGGSTLLAQAYIEDHPASGLVLIHPPGDEDPRQSSSSPSSSSSLSSSTTAAAAAGKEGTWSWPVFRYEPHFPLLILSSQSGLGELSVSNRLVREAGQDPAEKHGGGAKLRGLFGRGRAKGVEIGVLDDGELNEHGRVEVERWMDREGF